MAKAALAFVAVVMVAIPAHGDCRHFFVKRQAVIVQQVAVPFAVYPPVYYSAGSDIQAEALAEKVARLVESKLALRQQQTAQPPANPTAFSKCIKCHSGPEAAGGVVLDGSPVSCHAYYRWGQIAGQGKDVPAKMAALVGSMTPEQKGAINDALLDLVATEPKPVIPPEPPVADGGLE